MMIINNNSNHYLSLNIRHHVKYLTYIASLIPTEELKILEKEKSLFLCPFQKNKKHLKKKKGGLNLAIPEAGQLVHLHLFYVFVLFLFLIWHVGS